MLDAYCELTRGKAMAKAAELQAWAARCAERRALRVRWRRGLEWAQEVMRERGARVREVAQDAGERKLVADAEVERRARARLGSYARRRVLGAEGGRPMGPPRAQALGCSLTDARAGGLVQTGA